MGFKRMMQRFGNTMTPGQPFGTPDGQGRSMMEGIGNTFVPGQPYGAQADPMPNGPVPLEAPMGPPLPPGRGEPGGFKGFYKGPDWLGRMLGRSPDRMLNQKGEQFTYRGQSPGWDAAYDERVAQGFEQPWEQQQHAVGQPRGGAGGQFFKMLMGGFGPYGDPNAPPATAEQAESELDLPEIGMQR